MSYITPASFDPTVPLNVNISGQSVTIQSLSGTAVTIQSLSGTAVTIQSLSGTVINTSVSGQAVNVSGQPANVSGNVVAISGQVVDVSISGDVVRISGQVVNANLSGVPLTVACQFLNTTTVTCTGASGGTALNAGTNVRSVLVESAPWNTDYLWVGGISGNEPTSGIGIALTPGSSVTFDIVASERIRIFAELSGEKALCIREEMG